MFLRPIRTATHSATIKLVVAVAVLAALGCDKHTEPANLPLPPPANVQVITVKQAKDAAMEEVVGTVRAKLRATLEAKVSGRITKLPVTLGQAVKNGDLVALLDAGEIRAKLAQARAALDQANAELKRFSALLAQDAVTRQEYDAVRARQRIAQATLEEAQTISAYTRVRAPFSGIVTQKFADVGDLASPGKPLVAIDDPTELRLEVNVPEALLGNVRAGMMLDIRVDAISVPLKGKAVEVAPTADPNSRTFLTKIDLPEHENLRAGQFGRAMIPTSSISVLRIPRSALVQRGQMETLFVHHQGKALLRLVKTGKVLGDRVEILAGLEGGEQVVVDTAPSLVDGQSVQVVP